MIYNLNLLRIAAMILVVLCHIAGVERKYGGDSRVLGEWFYYRFSGVDALFTLSGFILALKYKEFSTFSLRRFYWSRCVKIVPTYWIVSVALLAVYLIQPTLINNSQHNQVDILRSFLLLPQEYLPLLAVGWTLKYTIFGYAILGILLKFFKVRHWGILFWLSLVVASIILKNIGISNQYLELVSNPFSLEFLSGVCLGLFIGIGSPKSAAISLIAGVAIFIVASFLINSNHELLYDQEIHRSLLFGVPSLLFVYGLYVLEISKCFVNNSAVNNIAASVYATYLTHSITIGVLGKIWQVYNVDGATDNIFWCSTMLILSFVIGRVFFLYVESPISKRLRLFFSRD